jgi:dienelactone hydrolase
MRLVLSILILSISALAQTFTPPPDLDYHTANIVSEGVRISTEVFAPKSGAGKKLPAIVMGHGWGGVAAQLRRDAVGFAQAGYLVVTFDYRGWGASDSRIATAGGKQVPVREVVDPLDMTTDWLNVLHWIQAEPQLDPANLGIWGSSYAGGHVVFAAARDPRVKALVSQVPALDSRPPNDAERQRYYAEATKMARGEQDYPAPRARIVGNLMGGPVLSKMLLYAPVDDVEKAPNCAMLFIIAEKEELFDNKDHGIKAYNRAKGPKKLEVIPGITHYGVYTTERERAHKLSQDWFDQYLKGVKP